MTDKTSESMNKFLRGAKQQAPTGTARPTPAQVAAAKDYAAVVGLTLTEALAVLSQRPVRFPRGDAGTGQGGIPPPKLDMNAWIRAKSGR